MRCQQADNHAHVQPLYKYCVVNSTKKHSPSKPLKEQRPEKTSTWHTQRSSRGLLLFQYPAVSSFALSAPHPPTDTILYIAQNVHKNDWCHQVCQPAVRCRNTKYILTLVSNWLHISGQLFTVLLAAFSCTELKHTVNETLTLLIMGPVIHKTPAGNWCSLLNLLSFTQHC